MLHMLGVDISRENAFYFSEILWFSRIMLPERIYEFSLKSTHSDIRANSRFFQINYDSFLKHSDCLVWYVLWELQRAYEFFFSSAHSGIHTSITKIYSFSYSNVLKKSHTFPETFYEKSFMYAFYENFCKNDTFSENIVSEYRSETDSEYHKVHNFWEKLVQKVRYLHNNKKSLDAKKSLIFFFNVRKVRYIQRRFKFDTSETRTRTWDQI